MFDYLFTASNPAGHWIVVSCCVFYTDDMWKYFEPIALAIFFFVIFSIDVVLYYTNGRGSSPVPYIICGVVSLGLSIITAMAEFEIFKHRHDKESW